MTEQRIPERSCDATPALPDVVELASAATPLELEHDGDPISLAAVLSEAYAMLAPGATIRVLLPARAEWAGRTARYRDRLTAAFFAAGFEKTLVTARVEGSVEVCATRSALAPPADRRQILSVVMPIYNERATLGAAITRVLDKEIPGVDIELVIVESNSTDGSRAEVLTYKGHPRVHIVLEEQPAGKGHAVRAGLAAAHGDYVLIQDADLEYDVDDYDALLAPLRDLSAGFVLGYRRRSDGARWGVRHFETQVLVGRLMNIGNIVFLCLFNAVYGSRLRDPFTMYKVFRRDCLAGMRLECNRFDFDWELTGKLLRAGYRPIEVPVHYQSRSFAEGKKVSVLADPLSWVVACFKYRFSPLYD